MQKCSFCNKSVYRLLSGLCSSCYQRQWKNGRLEYVKVRKPCSVDGCENLSVAQTLCEKHYRRKRRRGVVESERFDRWGHSTTHPLYDSWRWISQRTVGGVIPEWSVFWRFVEAVGERPSDKHRVGRLNKEEPYGPNNFEWVAPSLDVPTATREGRAAWMRAYRIANPRKFKDFDLRKNFGIGIDEYERIYGEQEGRCAICGEEERAINSKTGERQNLAVDHCHKSKAIRGLLCADCNTAIGLFKESPDRMIKAIRYLRVL